MADYFSGNFQIFVFFLALDQLRLEKEVRHVFGDMVWYRRPLEWNQYQLKLKRKMRDERNIIPGNVAYDGVNK